MRSFSLSSQQGGCDEGNLDGVVDIFDVNSVSDHWGTGGPQGDVNGDGIVDVFDVNMISDNWGATGGEGGMAVPEPTSFVGAIIAIATYLGCRRKGVDNWRS